MSRARAQTASRAPRRRRPARHRASERFSQEVEELGDTTAGLPGPLRRAVIEWVYEMLALARLARREFSRLVAKIRPPERPIH